MINNNEEMHEKGFFKYNELSDKSKKVAYDRFAWDFINNKWSDKSAEEILNMLAKHWFDKNGSTYLGTY